MSDRIRKINKSITDDAEKIINFVHYAEKLKTELRYAFKSDNQKESVADHTWRVALMLMLVMPKLKVKINPFKALKIAIVHDIVEIEAKDVPVLDHICNNDLKKDIRLKERQAINKINNMLGENGKEISELWEEYEDQKTIESKIIKAVDKLEGQMQFITESVTKFKKEEEERVHKLLAETSELSKVDPFLEVIDKLTTPDRLKRLNFRNE